MDRRPKRRGSTKRISRWSADRKSTRLNSSHTAICTLSGHDALPICCRLLVVSCRLWGARLVNGQTAKAARVDKADFAVVGKGEDSVRMERQRDFRLGDEQTAGHPEVNEEFRRALALPRSTAVDGHDDGFADAADAVDGCAGERFGNFSL